MAKKYNSTAIIAHLTKPTWTLVVGSSMYHLHKDGNVITSPDTAISYTIACVLGQKIAPGMIGGPQAWAEIAAFAGNTDALKAILAIASAMSFPPLNDDRITCASKAGLTRH